jgi:hypothetical protein
LAPSPLPKYNSGLFQFKKWLSEEEKGSSPLKNSPSLPRRVPEVLDSASSSVFLKTIQDMPLTDCRYICSSHRWPSEPFLKATTKDILDMENGILLQGLTQNFQDTVLVTRSLELNTYGLVPVCQRINQFN